MKNTLLQDAISKKGIKTQKLAKKVGVSTQYIYHLISRFRNPSMAIAQKICDILGNELTVSDIRECTRDCFKGCPCSQKK